MRRKMELLVILLSLLSLSMDVVYGEKSCREAVSVVTKRQLVRVADCTSRMKFKNLRDKEERQMCVLKCVFREEGIIDEEGNFDLIGTLVWAEKNVPPANVEVARGLGMKCYQSTINLDAKETNCQTYDPLYKCTISLVNSICEVGVGN